MDLVQINISKKKAITCPEGCNCEKNSVVCYIGNWSSVHIPSSRKVEVIIKKESEDSVSLTVQNISVITSKNVMVKNKKLYFNTSRGGREIKVLPAEISYKIKGLKIQRLELKEENQIPVYFVEGVKEVKLFGLIPISLEIEAKINAETGEIVSIRKPWWCFLGL